jgi:subtilisin family serine protease
MYIQTAARHKVELELVPSSVEMDRGVVALRARGAEEDGGLVNNATRAFFGFNKAAAGGVGAASARRAIAAEPPPGVFREKKSGLLRCVHKEIVLRFRRDVSETKRAQILAAHDLAIRSSNRFVGRQLIVLDKKGRRAGPELLEISNACMEMEEIEFATPNFVSQFIRVSLPLPHAEQWHLHNTGAVRGQKKGEDVSALEAWKISRGLPSVIVAVLDDGVDVDHPNLRAAIKRKPAPTEPRDLVGRDFFVPNANDPEHFDPRPKKFRVPYDDVAGNDIHGTPCAGVIAAQGLRAGALGIASRCRILAVKIFHGDALAAEAQVADAIRYAALNASILSCSWYGARSTDIELALQDALEFGRGGKGAAVFCATGNDGKKKVGYPASDQNAIGIGATTDEGKLAWYSNTGRQVWLTAPSDGGKRGIFTTDVSIKNRGFNTGKAEEGGVDGLHTNKFGGTSSATPLAAGIAALVLSVNPNLSVPELKELLASSSEKIGSGYDAKGHSKKFGFGRINAAKAVQAARAKL